MATIETDLIQQPATGGARDVMMVIAVNADGSPISGGGGGPVDWDAIENKPAVIASGNTQALARAAIGAGTSNLALGTTASTALAGNTSIPSGRNLVPVGGANGQVLKIVDDAPAWGADNNTTYTAMTQVVADAGTSTTANTINALVLKTTIDNALAPLIARLEALETVNPGPTG